MPNHDLGAIPPSGRQFRIEHGETVAVVTEVGAGLRCFGIGDSPVVWGYDEAVMASGGRGQVLAPWPNRIDGGTYEFAGKTAKAALDEPEHGNAIHGLVRWINWQLESQDGDVVALSCQLAPQPGYPWRLRLGLEYRVATGSLSVRMTVENLSRAKAPFGFGWHPYLAAGEGLADSCRLTVPGERRLLANERGIPVGDVPVEGTAYDYRSGRSLDGVELDDCFSGLEHSRAQPEGAAWEVELDTGERRVGVWGDESFGYVMCFTGDTLPPGQRRGGVAVEPMTCPPNAFRTGEALWQLEPGAVRAARYGVRLLT